MKYLTLFRNPALLVLVIAVMSVGCPPAPLEGDAERGGALYDNWWAVTGDDAPVTNHPLWATRPDQESNSRTGADTWRCKECHGWDYKGVDGAYGSGSHRTGFPGILDTDDVTLRTKTTQEVFDLLKTDHGYGAVLSDTDITDLAQFVLDGLLDTDDIIDESKAFIGDVEAGQTLFAGTCASCHGADGLTPPPGAGDDFEDFPGLLADDNPWEFQHKVSFGQPGTAMPPQLAILTVAQIGDLGAFIQTLPTEPLPPGTPNVLRGGQLYDQWWAVTGAAAPTTDHPLWATRPDEASNSRTGADTWRCKECHGWDYKGVNGAYGSGSHRTGFEGINNVAGATLRAKSAADVFNLIKTDHGYGDVLEDSDILDLTEFVLAGQLDTDDIIDGTGAYIGNPTAGQTLYGSACSACHGADGLMDPPGSPDFEDWVGLLSNDNPWEFQHKVSYGQPGSIMPGQAANLSVGEIGDLGAHAQTLPVAP